MADCKSCTTLVDTSPKVSTDTGAPGAHDASEFRSMTGALQYLIFTRSDLAYDVQ
jgi:hypothetical protein